MATIDKKLIHFAKLSDFKARLAAGDILDRSIICIKDAKLIWTHGTYYDCSSTDLSSYLTANQIAEVYATISDLKSKQDKITDLEEIRSGAAKGATALQSYTEKYTGTYSKPSTGIPKTDLASAVQTSLGKADTALQSYTEKYTGTITGIKMNGSSKGTSGVVDLGTVITAHQDISGKQDKLVSGTSIKTINGVSLLGSGNIGMIWATATNGVDYPSVTIN